MNKQEQLDYSVLFNQLDSIGKAISKTKDRGKLRELRDIEASILKAMKELQDSMESQE